MNFIVGFFTADTGEIEYKKLIVTSIIAIITSIGSIFANMWITAINSSRTKKTTYINTITSNRINWIQNLKIIIDSYFRKTQTSNFSPIYYSEIKKIEYFQELSRIRNEIFLQLNYKGYIDNKIMKLVNEIYYRMEVMYEIDNLLRMDNNENKMDYLLKHYKKTILDKFSDLSYNDPEEIEMLMNSIKRGESIPEKLNELINSQIESFNESFRKTPRKLSSEIEGFHNELLMYVQIYLKLEWNRVKDESKGYFKTSGEDKYKRIVDKMVSEYDLKLYDFTLDKLPQYLE